MRAIEGMLVSGDSSMRVAEVIQNEWGEITDVSALTLSKQIQRYKTRVLDAKLVVATERATSRGVSVYKAAKELNVQIDVLTKLSEMAEDQWARYSKAKGIEEKGPLLMEMVNREQKAMTDILLAISKLQFDMGLVARAPRKSSGILEFSDGSAVKFEVETKEFEEMRKAAADAILILRGEDYEVVEDADEPGDDS